VLSKDRVVHFVAEWLIVRGGKDPMTKKMYFALAFSDSISLQRLQSKLIRAVAIPVGRQVGDDKAAYFCSRASGEESKRLIRLCSRYRDRLVKLTVRLPPLH
jgi:hypothetical protein